MLIKVLRQKKLLSQEQLAESCGLSLRTIQRAESGNRVGYASLRALAAAFDYDADQLEYELYALDKRTSSYKDFPLIVRLTLGWGWCYTARSELQKVERFFQITCLALFTIWICSFYWDFPPAGYPFQMMDVGNLMGCFAVTQLFTAYCVGCAIRIGDRYDVWSRLEADE